MAEKKPAASAGIDPEMVKELAAILRDSGLTEIEVQHGDLKLRLSRAAIIQAGPPAHPVAGHPPPAASAAAPAAPQAQEDLRHHPGAVTSPMVGTAYRRPSPEAKPFVEVGSVVKQGERIMLVEAMKTFNDIVAPRAGKVTAILVEDGQPVEYGEPLLVIE